MMENLRKAIEEEINGRIENSLEWARRENGSLKHYLTDLRIKQLDNGSITREKALEMAEKKIRKTYAKELEKELKRIEEVEKAGDFNGCTINVEWARGSMQANQAKATLMGCGYIEGSRTGGCGYDKESTACSEVLNQCFPLMKLLYKYRNNHIEGDNGSVFGYGSGYSVKPYFEGGVGVSCYDNILNKIGYTWRWMSGGNKFDCYEIVKIEA